MKWILLFLVCQVAQPHVVDPVDGQKTRMRMMRAGIDPEVAVFIVFPLSSTGKAFRHSISLAQAMTAQEAVATGVAAMNKQQRQAMEQWFTIAVDHTVQETLKASGVYDKVASNRKLVECTQSAEVIRLDDGSLWQVAPNDRAQLGAWKATDAIQVSEPDKGEFPYQITDGNQLIHARLVGGLP